MNTAKRRHRLSCILCLLLIASVALLATGCTNKKSADGASASSAPTNASAADGSVLGEGDTQFYLIVADKDGNEVKLDIRTNKTKVGDALLELGVITGDPGPYGLYVKTVNGIAADYEKDGVYWAFYVGDAYATAGVDTTDIAAGTTYALRVEK